MIAAPVWALKALSFLKAIPWQIYAVAALCALLLGLRWHWIGVGYERCQAETAEAEQAADDKASKVAKGASEKAATETAIVRKESQDAATEIREVVRYLPRTCTPQSDRVRELGAEAVRRAREALPAGKDG